MGSGSEAGGRVYGGRVYGEWAGPGEGSGEDLRWEGTRASPDSCAVWGLQSQSFPWLLSDGTESRGSKEAVS